MRLFQAPLDTPLDSPFSATLSVHGLHFTVCAPSNYPPFFNYYVINSEQLLLEYVNGVFQTGFLYFGFRGVGKGGLERGWGGVGEGLGKGWGGGWGGVGAGLGRAWISLLQKPRLKNPVNVP